VYGMPLIVLLIICTDTASAISGGPSVVARRWWNSPNTQSVGERHRLVLDNEQKYALLFFRKSNQEDLRRIARVLNRLHARHEWSVVGLSPDDPNEVMPLVYRCRMRFPVGAGTEEHRRYGVEKWPCLVLLRSAGDRPELCEAVDDVVRRLVGDLGASKPTSAPVLPDAPHMLSAQLPVRTLRDCALEAPEPDVRLAALELLQAQLAPEAFDALVGEAMVAEPPMKYQQNFATRALWQEKLLRKFTRTPDVMSYPGWTMGRGYPESIRELYSTVTEGARMPELAQAYLAHLGDSPAELTFRQFLVFERFPKRPPDELLAHLPTLITAESDPFLRWLMVWRGGEAWSAAAHDYSSAMVPALLECLRPENHPAVRAMAQEALEMIYEGRR